MQLRQLQYFVAVAEQLNFRRAADLLYVSQPLLSRQIADLEAELGQKLLIRNTRTVELTPAGQLLLTEARALLQHADAMVDLIKHADASENIRGTLRIGYEQSFGRITLVKAVRSFRQKYPNIALSVQDYTSPHLFRALRENTIDCAFILLPDRKLNHSYSCRLIQNDELCFVAAKRRILNNTLTEYIELAQNEALYLLSDDAKGYKAIRSICESLDITPHFRYVDSLRIMLLYAEAGKGVGIIPWAFYEAYETPYLSALKIGSKNTFSCMACIWHNDKETTLCDLLLAEFPMTLPRCADCINCGCLLNQNE